MGACLNRRLGGRPVGLGRAAEVWAVPARAVDRWPSGGRGVGADVLRQLYLPLRGVWALTSSELPYGPN
jgi:hypothetical protein